MISRRRALFALLATPGCLTGGVALAESTWPVRPIRVVVPWPAGGSADSFVRPVVEPLGAALGQPMVLDFRPGASGGVGLTTIAHAQPDGYTVGFVSVAEVAIRPASHAEASADVSRIVPVARHVVVPVTAIAAKDLPAPSLRELAALGRRGATELRFASSGIETTSHLAGEAFGRALGLRLVHVPYKGAAAALTTVAAGEVELGFPSPSIVAPMNDAGRIRVVAVLGSRRVPLLPGVPTVREAGYPDLDFTTWFGWVAPAGTPPGIVARLNEVITRVLATPEVVRLYAQSGSAAAPSTPKEFALFLAADRVRWADIVRQSGGIR